MLTTSALTRTVKQKLTFKGRDSGFWHDISNRDLKSDRSEFTAVKRGRQLLVKVQEESERMSQNKLSTCRLGSQCCKNLAAPLVLVRHVHINTEMVHCAAVFACKLLA